MFARVTKRFEFEAAHHLPDHLDPDGVSPGKCSRPHGHSYKLEVTLYGPVAENPATDLGFVVDFYNLGQIVKEKIINVLDHQDLTTLLPFRTTAELMSYYFFGLLLNEGLPVSKVRLYETRTGSAEAALINFHQSEWDDLANGRGPYARPIE